jgi:hypothetical protein
MERLKRDKSAAKLKRHRLERESNEGKSRGGTSMSTGMASETAKDVVRQNAEEV